jgi:hypothetical protein
MVEELHLRSVPILRPLVLPSLTLKLLTNLRHFLIYALPFSLYRPTAACLILREHFISDGNIFFYSCLYTPTFSGMQRASKASLGGVLLFVDFLNHERKLSYRYHKHLTKCQIRFTGGILKRNIAIYNCISPLNAELNPICHMLVLLGGATIVVVSRLRVNNLYSGKSRTNIGGEQDMLRHSKFCY